MEFFLSIIKCMPYQPTWTRPKTILRKLTKELMSENVLEIKTAPIKVADFNSLSKMKRREEKL